METTIPIKDMTNAHKPKRVFVKRYFRSSLSFLAARELAFCIALRASSFIPQIYKLSWTYLA